MANAHASRHLFDLISTEPLQHHVLLRRDTALGHLEERLGVQPHKESLFTKYLRTPYTRGGHETRDFPFRACLPQPLTVLQHVQIRCNLSIVINITITCE